MCGHGRIESRVNGNTLTPPITIANEHIKATNNMLPKMMQAKNVNTSWWHMMFNACWRLNIDKTLVRDTGITAHVRYIKEQSKWQQVPSFQGELRDTKLYAVLDLLCSQARKSRWNCRPDNHTGRPQHWQGRCKQWRSWGDNNVSADGNSAQPVDMPMNGWHWIHQHSH